MGDELPIDGQLGARIDLELEHCVIQLIQIRGAPQAPGAKPGAKLTRCAPGRRPRWAGDPPRRGAPEQLVWTAISVSGDRGSELVERGGGARPQIAVGKVARGERSLACQRRFEGNALADSTNER